MEKGQEQKLMRGRGQKEVSRHIDDVVVIFACRMVF